MMSVSSLGTCQWYGLLFCESGLRTYDMYDSVRAVSERTTCTTYQYIQKSRTVRRRNECCDSARLWASVRAAELVCQSGVAEFELFGPSGTTGKLDSFYMNSHLLQQARTRIISAPTVGAESSQVTGTNWLEYRELEPHSENRGLFLSLQRLVNSRRGSLNWLGGILWIIDWVPRTTINRTRPLDGTRVVVYCCIHTYMNLMWLQFSPGLGERHVPVNYEFPVCYFYPSTSSTPSYGILSCDHGLHCCRRVNVITTPIVRADSS